MSNMNQMPRGKFEVLVREYLTGIARDGKPIKYNQIDVELIAFEITQYWPPFVWQYISPEELFAIMIVTATELDAHQKVHDLMVLIGQYQHTRLPLLRILHRFDSSVMEHVRDRFCVVDNPERWDRVVVAIMLAVAEMSSIPISERLLIIWDMTAHHAGNGLLQHACRALSRIPDPASVKMIEFFRDHYNEDGLQEAANEAIRQIMIYTS